MEASTMYQTKNDVLDHTRADVIALLNAWLADRITLMQQAKNAYWKVQETTRTALHTLFDEIVDAAEESLDLLAERVMHLGELTEGKLQGATQCSRIYRMAPQHPSWDRGLWQTPPRHPCHQWERKLTGSSRGKSRLGTRHFPPYTLPMYYML
jgi:DNA-binding ferritin-like protein